jgi:PAS domain S-box-containing protein
MAETITRLDQDLQAEVQALRRQLRLAEDRERLMNEVDLQTRHLVEPDEITLRAATLLGVYLDVNRCAYADVEKDQDTFNITGNYTHRTHSIVGRFRFGQFSRACLDAMRRDEPFVVTDSETDPRTQEVLASFRATAIRSVICVPLLKDDVFTAAMAVHCNTVRTWQPEEVALVRAVASRCWESIERTRVLREYKDSEERLRLSLEAGCAGTFEWQIPQNQVFWSPELERLYAVSTGTFEGSFEDWGKRVQPEDVVRIQREIEEVLRDRRSHYGYDFRAIMPDGQLHWLHGQARFTYSEAGEPLRMIGINIDIHERRMAEQALLRTEKLAAVGRLAASIAHEINNPLEAVTNLLYLARHAQDRAAEDEFLAAAEEELRRVSVISNQTLRFYRQSTQPKSVNCGELFESVLSIFRGKLTSAQIRVEERQRSSEALTCFDGEIRQVLSNLIGNAIDAMRPGGRLLLRSHSGRNWRTGEQGIVLTVADTGSGISQASLGRMFEPFFTTKGNSGNGLGLWVSHEIVERHRGSLRVRSSQREGHSGTVFALFLPLEAAPRA